ncbi:unnamed protein product [Calypogeia fissa]
MKCSIEYHVQNCISLAHHNTIILIVACPSLCDIDDSKLVGYMNNDEEVCLKTIIWTEMNKEYIQEQETTQAALNAMEQARAIAVAAATSNSASAAELAAAAAVAIAQMKKDQKQKRADDAKRAQHSLQWRQHTKC